VTVAFTALAITVGAAGGLAATGCARSQPPPANAAARSRCGDQCRAMTCPADTHCAFTENCTPRCELDVLQRR